MTNEDIIAAILEHEGGFVNHPADHGGPTNFGITQKTLSAWRGMPVTAADVEALSRTEAKQIYRVRYLERPGFDKIWNGSLRHLAVDSAVQHGTERVVKWIQALIVCVTVDGKLGPKTAAAINGEDAGRLFNRLLARRIRFYGGLIGAASSQAVFAAGWMNRAASFLDA
jgi:lysozyme family protein